MRRDRRGVVYLETLIAFLPVFTFFLGTLHIADLGAARLIVNHAANATARAAVVVLPDDGLYYDDRENQLLHRYEGLRRDAVEHATELVLSASPRLSKESVELSNGSDPSLGAQFGLRDALIAKVSAQYRCLVAMFCPGGIDMESQAELTYQGALYVYELNTNLIENATNKGSNLVRNGRQPDPESDNNDGRGDQNNDGRGDQNNDGRGDQDNKDGRSDLATQGPQHDTHRPGGSEPEDNEPKGDDGPLRPDPELQAHLPSDLQDVPVIRDPNLPGSTVEVRYVTDEHGVITDIVVHAGPDAGPRHIQDHADTVRVMQRYQGAMGRARAIGRKLGELLVGRPDLGPGTRAWEAKREVDKLSGILENRARQLENPDLTPEQRAELEREVADYEQQLAHYQSLLPELRNELGIGSVAAFDSGRPEHVPRDLVNQLASNVDDALTHDLDPATRKEVEDLKAQVDALKKDLEAGELNDPNELRDRTNKIIDQGNAIIYADSQRNDNADNPALEPLRSLGAVPGQRRERGRQGGVKRDSDGNIVLSGNGEERARQLGWPAAPPGHHWVNEANPDSSSKPRLDRLENNAGTPRLEYDEATNSFRQAGTHQAGGLDGLGTVASYPSDWTSRPHDTAELGRHAQALDAHEQKFQQRLEDEKNSASNDTLGSYRAKLTEVKGERAATGYMLEHEKDAQLIKGFAAGTGFDQVWVKKDAEGKVTEIIVVEAKGPNAQLSSDAAKGPQMSRQWVEATARELAARPGNPNNLSSDRGIGEAILASLQGDDGAPPVTGRVIQGEPGDNGAKELDVPDDGRNGY